MQAILQSNFFFFGIQRPAHAGNNLQRSKIMLHRAIQSGANMYGMQSTQEAIHSISAKADHYIQDGSYSIRF